MQKREEKPALTGLRGFAALWVVLYHTMASDQAGIVSSAAHAFGPLSILLNHGYLAVDVFFCLSGYVIAFSYGNLIGSFSMRNYATFLIRRVARIYPLYFAVTLLTFVKAVDDRFSEHTPENWAAQLGANILLVEAWGFKYVPIVGPSWSISTEFAAYIVFPLLASAIVVARPRIAYAVTIGFFICVVLATYAWVPPAEFKQGPLDVYWPNSGWPLLRCFAGFSFGLFAFRLGRNLEPAQFVSRPPFAVLVAAAWIALAAISNSDLILVALVPLVMLTLVGNGNPVTRLLESKVALALGNLSYSIYLLHQPLYELRFFLERRLPARFGAGPNEIVAFIVYFATLFVLAALCYRFLETPARRAIRARESRIFEFATALKNSA